MIARRTVASMKIFQLEALRSDVIENELAGAIVFAADEAQARKIATEHETYAVSYTHLTLPTIYSV